MELFTILVLVAIYESLQILDIYTTSLGLKRGLVEGNPILKKAIQTKVPIWLITLKMSLPLTFIPLSILSLSYDITLIILKSFIVVGIIIISLVVANNCVCLIKNPSEIVTPSKINY